MGMIENRQSPILPTLNAILYIQVGAFILFHLLHGVIYTETYVCFESTNRWFGDIIFIGYQLALFVPAALMVLLAAKAGYSALLFLPFALASLYVGYEWQYPLLTGFLQGIGHIESYSAFLFDRLPSVLPGEC